MDHRLGVLYVQVGYVVADLDGVAVPLITVEMVARASVLLVVVPLQLHLLHLVVVVAMLAALSVRCFLIKCLNIGTIQDVKVMDSTLTMLSFLLLDLSMALAQLVMLLHVKESLRLSWLKPLMRPQISSTTNNKI